MPVYIDKVKTRDICKAKSGRLVKQLLRNLDFSLCLNKTKQKNLSCDCRQGDENLE